MVRAPNFALFAFCTQRVPTTAPGLAQCQAHVMRLLPAPAAVAVPAQRRAHTRVAPGLMAGKDRRGAAATMARGAAARRPPAASRGSVRATRDPARNILEAVWLIGRITIQLCQKILLFWNLCDVVSSAGTSNCAFSVDTEMANGGHATWAACIFLAMLVGADAGPDNAHASELLSYVPRLPVAAGLPRSLGRPAHGHLLHGFLNWRARAGLAQGMLKGARVRPYDMHLASRSDAHSRPASCTVCDHSHAGVPELLSVVRVGARREYDIVC